MQNRLQCFMISCVTVRAGSVGAATPVSYMRFNDTPTRRPMCYKMSVNSIESSKF